MKSGPSDRDLLAAEFSPEFFSDHEHGSDLTLDVQWIMRKRLFRIRHSMRSQAYGMCLSIVVLLVISLRISMAEEPPSVSTVASGLLSQRQDSAAPGFSSGEVSDPLVGIITTDFSSTSGARLLGPMSKVSMLQDVAVSPNQVAVASLLDTIKPISTGNLLTMIDTLGAESTIQQRASLMQLSGELYGNTQTIGLQVGDQFQQRLTTRLVSNGPFLTGSTFKQAQQDSTFDFLLRGQSVGSSSGGWVQGYGAGGKLLSDSNGAGLNYSQAGLQYGLDLAADESGVVGVALGNSYVGFDGFGGGGHLVANQIGLYALKQDEVAYVLGSTNYGYESFDTNRNILLGGMNQTTRGNFGANQFGASFESGLKWDARLLHIQPLVGLQYLYLGQQGFGESGGAAALNIAPSDAASLRFNLGGRIVVHQLKGPRGSIWSPYWHARWVSELLDNDRLVNASFIGAPLGGAFTTHGDRLGTNYGIIGKGLQVQFNEQWSLFVNYDGMFGGRIDTYTGSGGVVLIW